MGELGDRGQELGESYGVADGVVEAEREDEAAAEQPGHLLIELIDHIWHTACLAHGLRVRIADQCYIPG
jgi:hypothetical protein